jgi:type VI secretion system secreted protein VgrG
MQETIAQLESALATAKALAASAQSAKAEPADTDAQQQMKEDFDGLKKPGLLMSTPASAAVVAAGGVQFAVQDSINAVAGKNADWSVLKRFTVAAGEKISLFAQKFGARIFAAKGPVEVQAQNDAMSLLASQDLTMESVNGTVRISAKKELTLESGGAFIHMKDGSITLGGPFDLFLKVITIQKKSAQRLSTAVPPLPESTGAFDEAFVAHWAGSEVPVANTRYQMFSEGKLIAEGTTNEHGETSLAQSHVPQGVSIRLKGN